MGVFFFWFGGCGVFCFGGVGFVWGVFFGVVCGCGGGGLGCSGWGCGFSGWGVVVVGVVVVGVVVVGVVVVG
ncbi:hypothetical protein RA269_27945 [Pseudomonas syringae pv. tagetis]|uniref:hypothetical protein n=1 Tax=Pseudomonas syringae group genomosp. 7 TaxID=251699 RepID=UPI0037700373